MALNNILTLPFNHLDEMSHDYLNYDINHLESLLNPIAQSLSKTSLLNSVDPDTNLVNSPSSSENMVEDEFNALTNTEQYDSCFSMMHVNSCCLIGNFHMFNSMIVQLYKSFPVIGISETWLNDQTLKLCI